MDNSNDKKFGLSIRPEVLHGQYSNLAVITHSPTEFIIDFATVLPGAPQADVASRVIMAPEHAKRLMLALNDNIAKYESQFGTIHLQGSENRDTLNLADFAPSPDGRKS